MGTVLRFAPLLICTCLYGAIALDNTIDVGSGSGTSISVSFTTAGSSRALLVACTNGGGSTTYITGVTYNSVTVPLVAVQLDSGSVFPLYLFYLTNPASGANTLQINAGGGTGFGCVAHSYNGVSQTGQPEANASSQMTCGNNVLCNQNLTTLSNNAWLVAGWSNQALGVFTCTSGNGETCTNMTSDTIGVGIADRGPLSTGANSISDTITGQGTAVSVAGVVVSMAPFVATSSLHLLTLLGVGQ